MKRPMTGWPTRTAVGVAATVALLGATVAPTAAIPPGGAKNDTAGTSASVSPRTLAPGARLSFTVSGFPAGETVYIKIDDGQTCSAAATHGGCVYHQQKLSSRGSASGSFALPADLGAGKHWLRFLASQEVKDADGKVLGVKGFTRRGGTDFTVVTASAGGGTGSSAGVGAGSGTSGGSGSTNEGSTAPVVPGATTTPGQPGGPAPAGTGGVVKIQPGTSASPAPSQTPAPAADGSDLTTASAPVEESDDFPVVGVSALVVLLLVAGAITWLGLRRKATGQADA